MKSPVKSAILAVLLSLPAGADDPAHRFWPQWRGPLGTGVAPHADPPIEWSETSNIRWKLPLRGGGHSTPAIWGDRLFVTVAVPYGQALTSGFSGFPGAHDERPVTHRYRFMVMAVRRVDGRVLWEKVLRDELPLAGGHYTASLASASPVTDGDRLIVSFGSHGIYGLDLDGKLIWEEDLGSMRTLHGHGEGSSPVLFQDTVVIDWSHEGESFLVAIDAASGSRRWQVEREDRSSWASPIVVDDGGRPLVVVSGSKRLRGYDLATGEQLWECDGLSEENVVATPVANDSLVFAGSSYDRQGMLAVRYPGARGDLTGSARISWIRSRGGPYVPSPLLYDETLYYHYHYKGILNGVDAETGTDRPGPLRLKGIRSVFASPIGVAGRIYVTDRSGSTRVITHEEQPRLLALNHLDDGFSASAAVVDGELYLRGEHYLYCIAAE